MKQTAVEWLRDLYENQPAYDEFIMDEQWQKAIEMEKEQIKGSWNHGFDWGMMEQSLAEQGAESTLIDAEHYYNETFNTEKPEFMQINQDNPVTKGSTALVRTFNTNEK